MRAYYSASVHLFVALAFLGLTSGGFAAQLPVLEPSVLEPGGQASSPAGAQTALPGTGIVGIVPEGYELAAGDVLSIFVQHEPEISSLPYTVDTRGFITVPLIGRVEASGRTLADMEDEITSRIGIYLKEPQVVLSLVQLRVMQVTVVGAVPTPGIFPVTGMQTLVEVIAEAGGVLPEAAPMVTVTRRDDQGVIPHVDALPDAGGGSTVALKLKDVMELRGDTNLVVKPGDIISIDKAPIVYIVVENRNQGVIPLLDDTGISLLDAVIRAGGPSAGSDPKNSTILRRGPDPDSSSQPVQLLKVDVEKIMKGDAPDVRLFANDLLYIPTDEPNFGEQVMREGLSSLINVFTWGVIPGI